MVIFSIEHKEPGDCSKALAAKGIPGQLKMEEEIQIKYTYSVKYTVMYHILLRTW